MLRAVIVLVPLSGKILK